MQLQDQVQAGHSLDRLYCQKLKAGHSLPTGLCQHLLPTPRAVPAPDPPSPAPAGDCAHSGQTKRSNPAVKSDASPPLIQKEAVRVFQGDPVAQIQFHQLIRSDRNRLRNSHIQQHLLHSEPGIPPMSHHNKADFHMACDRFSELTCGIPLHWE